MPSRKKLATCDGCGVRRTRDYLETCSECGQRCCHLSGCGCRCVVDEALANMEMLTFIGVSRFDEEFIRAYRP